MFNAILDLIYWFLSNVAAAVTFPIFDFIEIWNTITTVLYYPVKILGYFNITTFFTLLNLDWGLTISLGLIKTVLKFIRGN